VRLLDTLAVCYRGRRITSESSESHRPRGAMTGAEGAVDVCFGSFSDIGVCIINVCFALKSRHFPTRPTPDVPPLAVAKPNWLP
jgi:hypothetical protein